MALARRIPNITALGAIRDRVGVRLGLASAAFLGRYSASIASLGLTPSKVLALSCISANPGLDQRSFAEHLAIKEASAMSAINRLETLGYVERRPGRDKRAKALFLTEHGKDALWQALEVEAAISAVTFNWRSEMEAEIFHSCLDRIMASDAEESRL